MNNHLILRVKSSDDGYGHGSSHQYDYVGVLTGEKAEAERATELLNEAKGHREAFHSVPIDCFANADVLVQSFNRNFRKQAG